MIGTALNKIIRAIAAIINKLEAHLEPKRARRHYYRNIHNVIWERAISESADFVYNYIDNVMLFRQKNQMWNYISEKINQKNISGIGIEFGVAKGRSINYLSKKIPSLHFFGFDSFIGLPEDWIGHHAVKGSYNQRGKLPKVNSNVSLVRGWFDETIPEFLNKYNMNDVLFIHIDSDTYQSATIILNQIGPKIKTGTLVLFDEFIGYPNWKNGEFKALNEAAERFEFQFKFLAFSTEQALIEIRHDE